jgi:hypothetical protein
MSELYFEVLRTLEKTDELLIELSEFQRELQRVIDSGADNTVRDTPHGENTGQVS